MEKFQVSTELCIAAGGLAYTYKSYCVRMDLLKRKNTDINRTGLKEQIKTLNKRVYALEGAMDEIYVPAKRCRY